VDVNFCSKPGKSYDLQKINIGSFLWQTLSVIIAFIPLFFFAEWIISLPGSEKFLPPPSPGFNFPFPEIEIKYKRYFNSKPANCMIFGSSLADAGVNPDVLEKKLDSKLGYPITCMNFGLSGAMVEVTKNVSFTMIDWHQPEVIFLGLSPFDFDKKYVKSRSMASLPVFTYYNGQPSFEGWIFNTFRLPWYFASLSNQWDPIYQNSSQFWEDMLDAKAFRNSKQIGEIKIVTRDVKQRTYSINPDDLDALDIIIDGYQKKDIKLYVFEMPTNLLYIPFFLRGGQQVYEQNFIKPVEDVLSKHSVELIRIQKDKINLDDKQYWNDRSHLNESGANKYTEYLANQIIERIDR